MNHTALSAAHMVIYSQGLGGANLFLLAKNEKKKKLANRTKRTK